MSGSRLKPFEFEVDKNGCFVCHSHSKNHDGYIQIRRLRRTTRLHRYIFEECFGPIEEGMVIRHKCDNRACINPEHLEIGTQKENVDDMVERGRTAKGEKLKQSDLTEKDVIDIRSKNDAGYTYKRLAEEYGVSITCIGDICRRWSWRHV